MRNRLISFLPRHLVHQLVRQPKVSRHARAERLNGAVLFADVSGFTPLAESLSQGGEEAPEELTAVLNHFFSPIIECLHRYCGDIIKFSGDALMVMFVQAEDQLPIAVAHAAQAAEELQKLTSELGVMDTSVGRLKLKIKIGIGAGDIVGLQVGGVLDRWEYLIAGSAVEQAAQAESKVTPGQVLLSDQAQSLFDTQVEAEPALPTLEIPEDADQRLIEKALSRFVPGAAMGWLNQKNQHWVSVLRPMTVLFIGSNDFDFSKAEDAERLQQAIRNIQKALYRFEGSLNKVAVDDKGLVIIALFGAPPLAHQDDPLRAAKAALAIRATAKQSGLSLSIGVTTGSVFAGLVGNEQRYEYSVMGDNVNLAARLMQHAGSSLILCDRNTYNSASTGVKMSAIDPVQVKGKADPVNVYRLDDRRLTARLMRSQIKLPGKLAGRVTEKRTIESALDRVVDGAGGVLLFEGESGIGKTRLLEEMQLQAKLKGVPVMTGSGRHGFGKIPLKPWQSVFESFFNIRDDQDPESRFQQVHQALLTLAPDHVDEISLLKAWFNLALPHGTTEIVLDPELLENSVVKLLDELLQASLQRQPMIIAMDDAQFLDFRSWRLLEHLARLHCRRTSPLIIAVATGPLDQSLPEFQMYQALQELSNTMILELGALSEDELGLMFAQHLKLHASVIPPALLTFVQERAKGVPFIALELLRTLQDQGVVEVWDDKETQRKYCRVRGLLESNEDKIPDSVRGMLLARMDKLDSAQQMNLRVAAVLGWQFSHDVLEHLVKTGVGQDPVLLSKHLESFVQLGLVEITEVEPQLSYQFAHPIIQQVAYDAILFSQRRKLHLLAAQWLENQISGSLPEQDPLVLDQAMDKPINPLVEDLVRHYSAAEQKAKTLEYCTLAARRALDLFQNKEALEHLSQALELAGQDDRARRFKLLMGLELAYERLAKTRRRQTVLALMSEIAEHDEDGLMQLTVTIRQANYQLFHGHPKTALELSEQAVKQAQQVGSEVNETRARHLLASSLVRTGDHQQAQIQMELAYRLARQTGVWQAQAGSLTELAAYADRRGDFSRCQKLCEQALSIVREHHDLGREAKVLRLQAGSAFALGHLKEAREIAGEAEDLQQRIGDQRELCASRDLLGKIAVATGDLATGKSCFEKTLGIRQQLGDRQGELRSLTLLGGVCFVLGAYDKARICYQQALDDANELNLAYDQAEINARLVLLEHGVGDHDKAKRHGLMASKSVAKLDHPSLLATVLTSLGHAFTELGEDDSASAAYASAIGIRKQLGQQILMLEAVAGSAKIDLRKQRLEAVQGKLDEILQSIHENLLLGSEQRFRIFHDCYEILEELEDGRAIGLLELAHTELEKSAQAISDQRLREDYLQNVPENRAIVYYYHRLHSDPETTD